VARVTPSDGQQLAAALAAAASARKATIVSGGGTKIEWGRPATVDLIISTSQLNGVTHRYGDVTATLGAGATLVAVNRELAKHGQWLPIDSAFEGATLGGIIATNDAGPRRHRFGTPRDLLLGVTMAMTDGRLVKAGGTVVKNVAGYDLGRLLCGSFGTLAAIESATFKLAPMPQASGSLTVRVADRHTVAAVARALNDSPLELTALEVFAAFTGGGAVYDLLVRIASSPRATAAQLIAAQAIVDDAGASIHGEREADLWTRQLRVPWEGSGATLRASWRPADLAMVLQHLEDVHRRVDAPIVLTGRIGVGAGTLRIDGTALAQRSAIEQLRSSPLLGHVVLLRADPAVKDVVDVWGPMGDAYRVMQMIKRKLDPAGILNAGRGPI
jgi:glycolate oxidase FAD binding subunit